MVCVRKVILNLAYTLTGLRFQVRDHLTVQFLNVTYGMVKIIYWYLSYMRKK